MPQEYIDNEDDHAQISKPSPPVTSMEGKSVLAGTSIRRSPRFSRRLTVDRRKDGSAHLSLDSPNNNHEVAIIDAGAKHGPTHSAHEEGAAGF